MGFTYDHIHLRTRDVAKAVNFYTTHLEADIIDAKRPDGGAAIRIGGATILISPLQDGQTVDPDAIGGRALDHFAFTVPNIDETAARLKAEGVVFSCDPMTLRPGLRIAFITAPDNVSIEIIQRG
jgi:catechol 2,3-dioxygenase-like lactoylglutathione lyase family enzyme